MAFEKGTVGREILEWVVTIVVGVALALLVRSYVFTLAIVDGSSMEDTLYSKQIMFVWKLGYAVGEPEQGDVVFCQYPNLSEHCVKRVIGLPGDTVEIRDSVVYVNDAPLDEPYLTRPRTSDFAKVEVPEGCYFVLGDNRGGSMDSRDSAVGALPKEAIEGKSLCVVWPLGSIGGIE